MKRFFTIFPVCENIHLTKDVGMIPYMLYKECNYNSTIVSYQNGSYPYLDSDVKGLKQEFIRKVFNNKILDSFVYILFNFRRIDVLQAYHFSNESLLILSFFKIIKLYSSSRNAVTYLKLDANDEIKNYKFKGLGGKLKKWLLRRVNLVSIETKKLHEFVNERNILCRQVDYIPNGFYDNGLRNVVDYGYKDNVIITVGRIGAYVKSNETLLEAFRIFKKYNHEWKLELVGPVEPNFQEYLNLYLESTPQLKDSIIVTGPIWDRAALAERYNRAKIFVLTSRLESFALVFLEAMKAGCSIISTAITPAYDITDNEKYGNLFPVGDIDILAGLLLQTVKNEQKLNENCNAVQNYAYNNFYWPLVVKEINKKLQNH